MTSSYHSVLCAAVDTARFLLKKPQSPSSKKLTFIIEEANKLALSYPTLELKTPGNEVVFDIFNLLKLHWRDIISGSMSFDQFLGQSSNVWERFMTEFPLGQYAELTAKVLVQENLLNGQILELGAGVGNTSRLIVNNTKPDQYTRTDLNIKLMKEYNYPSKLSQYDFNKPGKWEDLDTIFATNALHCAEDKLVTLKNLYQMLKPGGAIVLGEGSPTPEENCPWALTYLCGFFDGWWDRGGFLSQEEWISLLKSAGFNHIQSKVIKEDQYQLGGVTWAFKI